MAKHKMTKAQEAKGGRAANKALNAETVHKPPPLSESYVGAAHHTMDRKRGKKKK